MKKSMTILAALLVCGVAAAGQLSTTWTLRNVVDPPDLRDGLNADAQAADARLDAIEAGASFTLVSNATLKVYGSNLVIKAGGTVTVPADSVSIDAVAGITASAAAINAAAGGTTATLTPTLVSNATAKVYGSNLVIKAGGSVSLPAGSVDATEIGSANFLVAVSNTFAAISINGTNFYMKTYP